MIWGHDNVAGCGCRQENEVAIDLITEHIRMKLQQPELRRIYHNLELMPSNFQIRGMHTLIRDRTTSKADFVFYADRLLRLVRIPHILTCLKSIRSCSGNPCITLMKCSCCSQASSSSRKPPSCLSCDPPALLNGFLSPLFDGFCSWMLMMIPVWVLPADTGGCARWWSTAWGTCPSGRSAS